MKIHPLGNLTSPHNYDSKTTDKQEKEKGLVLN